ncbi:MAG TPA: FMN-binding protein [Gemmatimonadales bacterium]|nr:FMN-binding protein [Gemmatimonadales bacterium]
MRVRRGAGNGERGVGRTARNPPSRRPAVLALLLILAARPAAAQSRLTQEEALRLAFPGAVVERQTAFLTAAQVEAVRGRAGPGAAPPPAVVTWYRARKDGAEAGSAWFDAHRVRTHSEVLMVVVGPDRTVRRVELLRFDEPPDYRPPAGWLALFGGRALADLGRGSVPPLTGATLTADAVGRAVRRSLALEAVVRGGGE